MKEIYKLIQSSVSLFPKTLLEITEVVCPEGYKIEEVRTAINSAIEEEVIQYFPRKNGFGGDSLYISINYPKPIKKEKTKLVKIWLKTTSQPLEFKDVTNTYEKGACYCIYISTKVVKIPIDNIFKIEEDYDFK